ncbi:Nodule Cysteine-Rich (NCR) secreted peptide [Medicago truncatula]|uniref:Nodule Cysteine-Rich (NCR) secreted peptide n=2 Tax=Medicago truncatula TaxID=3880 RepID=G7K731_MEDTR|nr:Nodule Cysteine-Rich (NCR) secreted peptide [Medicago truncatula]
MTEILKFVYVMFLFISMFIVTTEVGGECINDIDCPQTGNLFYVFICKNRICELINKYPQNL